MIKPVEEAPAPKDARAMAERALLRVALASQVETFEKELRAYVAGDGRRGCLSVAA